MPERDGYIPGVPCWVDTSQPDPEAARRLLQRPVRMGVRGRDAAGIGGQVLHRPHPRRRRRRGRLDPRGRAADGDVEHLHLGRQRRRDGVEGPRRRRQRGDGAVRRHGRRADGGLHRSRGSGVLRLAGEGAQGRAGRQRARLAELQRPRHPRRRGRQGVLRRGVRLEDARRLPAGPRCGRCPATATTSRRATPGLREQMAQMGAPEGLHRRRRRASTRSPTTSPTRPPHWSVTFGVDDADATAAKADRARRRGRSPRPSTPRGRGWP